MSGAVAAALARYPMVSYALLFGSRARNTQHANSDVDVALGLRPAAHLDGPALGRLIADLEAQTGLPVDVTLLDEAPPALAYRVFRDGQPVLIREPQELAARKARAILDYLDFRPHEERCVQGVLRAARGR